MPTPEQSPISGVTSPRRIHILSVIDDLYFGGDEHRLHAFGTFVDRSRFRHTVVTVMKEDRTLGERHGSMRDMYRDSGIRLLDLGHPPISPARHPRKRLAARFRSSKSKFQKLITVIQDEQVGILDVHLAPGNPIGALAALRTGIPFTVTLYQVTEMQSAKLWVSGQFNLGRAASLIIDSDTQAAQVRKWLMHAPPIHVIPNGTLPPQATVSKDQILRTLKIPADQPLAIIGQVSSLISYKGQLVLIEAAKRVLERHPNCIFLLVGYERRDTGYREALLQRAAALGISDKVLVVSYPGPIGDIWNIIDIHAHASLMDSLPNALIEAMSLGKPSVVTSVGGIPEVVRHGYNGMLTPPGDPEQFAQNLLKLLEDSQLRENIGREAQASYSQKFSPLVMTRRLEGVFFDLAAKT
jgi:glycosyltransferase involved in cell wall biosynthesis